MGASSEHSAKQVLSDGQEGDPQALQSGYACRVPLAHFDKWTTTLV